MANEQQESEHYVARLTIERVVKRTVKVGREPYAEKVESKEREVSELAGLTLKAGTLAKLTNSLSNHIHLIEEDHTLDLD